MKRRAFTLIELLVVVGIIALLLGITLPALSGAKAAAHRVVCLSQLSQVGKAVMLYTADARKRVPYVEEPLWDNYASRGGKHDWHADPMSSEKSLLLQLADYADATRLMKCPDAVLGYPSNDPLVTYRIAAANNADGRPMTAAELPAESTWSNYNYGLKFLNGRRYAIKHVDPTQTRFQPGRGIAYRVVDGAGPFYLLRDFIARDDASGQMTPPHGERFNQLFIDTSARTVDPDELQTGLTHP